MQIESVESKYSMFANNTERHGEKFKSGWTLPQDYNLTVEQFETAFGRQYDGRRYFDEKKGTLYYGSKGFIKGRYTIEAEYENASVRMKFVGGREISFDGGCGVSGISFLPVDGGMFNIKCNVYVHPDTPQKILLDDNQHSTVTLSILNGTIATKSKDKQQDLFPGKSNGNGADAPAVGEGFAAAAAAAAAKKTQDDGAAAKAQAEAYERGRPVGVPADTH